MKLEIIPSVVPIYHAAAECSRAFLVDATKKNMSVQSESKPEHQRPADWIGSCRRLS
jgi:hypothetical protein